MLLQQRLNVGFVVEWRVIDNDDRVWLELGYEALLEPTGYEVMMAATGEGQRREPLLTSLRHNQISATFFVIAGDLAMHQLAALCPTVWAIGLRIKAALIHVYHVL